jgi:hypothetical protein
MSATKCHTQHKCHGHVQHKCHGHAQYNCHAEPPEPVEGRSMIQGAVP